MYSAQQLEVIGRRQPAANEVLQQLIDAMVAGVSLSIAEEDFIGSYLGVARNSEDERLSLHDFPACQNYLFKRNYLLYLGNFKGLLPAKGPLGLIPTSEVIKDIAQLDRFYNDWLSVIQKENHSDRLLQYVGKESRNQLKNSRLFAAKLNHGSHLREATERAIVLHSKYFYYKVKKYFQEVGTDELVVNYCGHTIIIDGYAHFHILFRHYARDVKPYQTDASYHTDQTIDPDILPTELGIFIDDYFETVDCSRFDAQRIYMRYNKVLYLLWFRAMPQYKIGKMVKPVLRLQTFYPVVSQTDLAFVSNLQQFVSRSGTIFYT